MPNDKTFILHNLNYIYLRITFTIYLFFSVYILFENMTFLILLNHNNFKGVTVQNISEYHKINN